ncbi:MAG: cadmium-translocating P-type ATPase [Butyrivibrio sp.]|jgi:Cd2+/Zn2+-exporting ATPase|nr:cadmium-translocating P-type ATPase [Butyrivibrio sp.]
MNKKQKKVLYRIIVSGILFFLFLILEKTGVLEPVPIVVQGLLFLVPYLIIGYDVLYRAFRNIRNGHVFDEHFLMMIATFAAFATGEFSEGCAVMLFYQVGELFQSVAVGKSRQSITEMMSIAPDFANILKDNGEIEEVDPEDVNIGDTIVVKAGEKIPLDGTVIEGESFLDTAALTGESVPRKVKTGEEVYSGCVNGEGTLKIKVSKIYEDSTVAKILEMVENASSKKARLENFITRFARVYTPIVTIGAVLLALLLPLFTDLTFVNSIQRACIFLIVSCPCALVISVPLGFFGGIGAASKVGVLVKGSNYLEAIADVNTIVFDKTGTLTKGEFKVSQILPSKAFSEQNANAKEDLIKLAAFGEALSNHPIAMSIKEAFGGQLDTSLIKDNTEVAGQGICALYKGKKLLVGNAKLMAAQNISYEECHEYGTIIYVAYDGTFAGTVIIADTIKEGAAEAISAMKSVGIRKTVMLTGDRAETAQAVAGKIGIDEVHSDLLPGDKVDQVEAIMSQTSGKDKVSFVGDGINDAPVLMRADVGIAMGSLGSDAAIEAADIVLMDDDISKIAFVVKIARKTMGIVKQNITFAIGVKVLVLILGAFGLASMWAAVFADVGVAVIAILNSMRTLNIKK